MRLIEAEINQLRHKVMDMAQLVQLQLERVGLALLTLDPDLVNAVRRKEKKVDKFDLKIDKRCERIIALYQPVANDLRFVFAVVKINAFLELIGDIIDGIARRVLQLDEAHDKQLLKRLHLEEMINGTKEMLGLSLDAFLTGNADKARRVFPLDDRIDEINSAAFKALVHEVEKHPKNSKELIRLLNIVQQIEKIADFAVSIAEEAIFCAEGVVYRHSELKYAYKTEKRPPHMAEEAEQDDANEDGADDEA
jgi:phosphate transport system protein